MDRLTKKQSWEIMTLLVISIIISAGCLVFVKASTETHEKQTTHLEKRLAETKEDLKETELKLNATESELNITKQALSIKSDRLKMIDARNEGIMYQETDGKGLDEE